MENAIHKITKGNIYWILLFAVAGFILLYIIKQYLPLVLRKERSKKVFRYIIPVLEAVFWIFIFYEAIPAFYHKHYLLGILIFTIALGAMVWFFWFRLRDYTAGLICRLSKNLHLNDRINIDGTTGKITGFKAAYLELESESGDTILMPYGLVTGRKVIKQQISDRRQNYIFEIIIPAKEDPRLQIRSIRRFIISQPWSSLSKDPQIRFIKTEKENNRYEITVYTPDSSYAEKIRIQLEEKFR